MIIAEIKEVNGNSSDEDEINLSGKENRFTLSKICSIK